MAFALGGGKSKGVEPVMNVTPLVDVVLVLLIIFMVVTPLLSKQFWVEVPKIEERKDNTPPPTDIRNIVMSVDDKGTIRVNALVVTKDQIHSTLGGLLAQRTEKTVYFNAHGDAPYGTVVDVLDESRSAGASTIAVITTDFIPPK